MAGNSLRQVSFLFPECDDISARDTDVARYVHLTGVVLPAAASKGCGWPVHADHCFRRIVLDHVSSCVWYDHIKRPAYRNMTAKQAGAAASLAQDIVDGRVDLHALNQKSLIWRGKSG